MKSGMAVAGKAVLSALGAAATAIGTLGVNAVKAYAEQEQLVGGVETLFKTSSAQVISYANDAYKTAGLSANQYMETVTSFSASLLQSLDGDTAKAAEVSNRAIIDMSDNANKMGTSMESIQNAYQGFAKQNYTMLDNLKLGYGGTKSEMERLIADAAKMTDVQKELGITVDGSSTSFGNIVNAISVMQASLGIAGTTSREAATTISGSVGMMKTAWQNLVAGLADDNANLGQLINNVVESAGTAAENILPRVMTVLSGIGTAVTTFAPMITSMLGGIFTDVLPGLVSSAGNLVLGIVSALTSNLPQIATAAISIVTELATGLGSALPTLIPAAVEAIITIVTALLDNVPQLVSAAAELIVGLATGLINAIPQLIQAAPAIIAALGTALIGAIPEILSAAWEIMQALGQALYDAAPASLQNVIDAIGNAFREAWETVKVVWDAVAPYFQALWAGIQAVWNAVAPFFKAVFQSAWDGIKTIWTAATGFFSAVWNSIAAVFSVVRSVLTGDFQGAWDGIRSIVGTWAAYFANVWNAIKAHFANVASFFGTAFASAKSAITNAVSSIPSYFSQLWQNIKNVFNNVGAWFSSVGQAIVNGIRNGISAGWSALTGFVAEKAKGLLNAAKSALGIASPSKVFRDEVGVMLAKGISQGFTLEMPRTIKDIQRQLDFTKSLNVPSGTVSRETHGGIGGGVTIIQNIYSEAKTAADLMREARWEAQKAVLTGV